MNGVEPLIVEGDVRLSMMASPKVADLRRRPRVLVLERDHQPGGQVEILVRASAREITDPAVQARYASAQTSLDTEDASYTPFDLDTGDRPLPAARRGGIS